MNSRSGVNESNLVNISTNLSTLDTLDAKDALSLSFPFDHIYACHSEGSDRSQTLSIGKNVEISTHCVVTDQKDLVVSTSSEINRLSERLSAAENQNKKLKDLLVYHLDLIQEQNDVITKREKLFQALKQENDLLKTKVSRMDRKGPANQKQTLTLPPPPPVLHVPPPACTSTVTCIKSEPSTSSQVVFNSYTELLLPNTRSTPYIFNEARKPTSYAPDPYNINKSHGTNVPSSYHSDLGVPKILNESLPSNNLTMIENKRVTFVKKEVKPEPRPEPRYTVTSNSGNPVIAKINRNRRRTTTSLGSLSRMPKTPVIKPEPVDTSQKFMYDDDTSYGNSFTVNKKSKMINTYGKKSTSQTSTSFPKMTTHFTGSLSDRLKLIDTTPTGEDPYQLGEADMREQSPIPKLMLQKTNHGRMKLCTDLMGNSTVTSRRIYDAPTSTTSSSPINLENRYNIPRTVTNANITKENNLDKTIADSKTTVVHDPDLDIVKTETEVEWPPNPTPSLDFGDSDNSQTLPRINPEEFQKLLNTQSREAKYAADCLEKMDMKTLDMCDQMAEGEETEKVKKRVVKNSNTTVAPDSQGSQSTEKRGAETKRGRKRASSTTGLAKGAKQTLPKTPATPKAKQQKAKTACRGKKSPLPGMISKKHYHTLVGDPDLSWYFGLDPEIKLEDIDQPGDAAFATVEVPRWREKPYTSCYSLEGTENLDDKVFEKRHQKLEAEERRQLRWHMRRIREQRHVERLRLRQRDSWCSGLTSQAYQPPSVFTIWPQPQRDVKMIEITDTLPVMAFGEDIPELPRADFILPWVRISKALKRSKRSKTLH